jgi:hypothetical protein
MYSIENLLTKKSKKINKVKIICIYINKNNEINETKTHYEYLDNNILNKERLLFLIKNNQYNGEIKHKISNILKYNIDLEPADLINIMNTEDIITTENNPDEEYNYLAAMNIVDDIKFNNSINILKNINSIFLIYTNNVYSIHNITKSTQLKTHNKKTKRKTI